MLAIQWLCTLLTNLALCVHTHYTLTNYLWTFTFPLTNHYRFVFCCYIYKCCSTFIVCRIFTHCISFGSGFGHCLAYSSSNALSFIRNPCLVRVLLLCDKFSFFSYRPFLTSRWRGGRCTSEAWKNETVASCPSVMIPITVTGYASTSVSIFHVNLLRAVRYDFPIRSTGLHLIIFPCADLY